MLTTTISHIKGSGKGIWTTEQLFHPQNCIICNKFFLLEYICFFTEVCNYVPKHCLAKHSLDVCEQVYLKRKEKKKKTNKYNKVPNHQNSAICFRLRQIVCKTLNCKKKKCVSCRDGEKTTVGILL